MFRCFLHKTRGVLATAQRQHHYRLKISNIYETMSRKFLLSDSVFYEHLANIIELDITRFVLVAVGLFLGRKYSIIIKQIEG